MWILVLSDWGFSDVAAACRSGYYSLKKRLAVLGGGGGSLSALG